MVKMRNKKTNRDIRLVKCDQVEEYTRESFPFQDSLSGVRRKKFVRCSSDIFSDLITEIQTNPKCAYDTYINDLIKEGYVPNYLSIIKKQTNSLVKTYDKSGLWHLKDVCASRILNYFECPTTFDVYLYFEDNNNLCSLYSCSVDFNRQNEDFYMFQGFRGLQEYIFALRPALRTIEEILKDFIREIEIEDKNPNFDTRQTIKQIKEGYVYSWLVRKCLLCDNDYGTHNIGIIHDLENNTIRLSPNYDFEWCFAPKLYDRIKDKDRESELDFVAYQYPDLYDKFCTKLDKFYAKGKTNSPCNQIIKSVVGDDTFQARTFLRKFNNYQAQLLKRLPENSRNM